jgi:hypothetical protein
MTVDTEQLAADIKRVMDLDAKRTQGEWLPFPWRKMPHGADPGEGGFINNGQLFHDGSENGHEEIGQLDSDADLDFGASAPLMADIIRRQQEVIREMHKRAERAQMLQETAWMDVEPVPCEIEARNEMKRIVSLSAPLVKEEV